MITICPHCLKEVDLPTSSINRAKKAGLKIYCSRVCAGRARRVLRTKSEKQKLKADYDKEYRTKNAELLKKKKHDYFKKTYNPEQAAIERKKRSKQHAEYCRQPEYKKWKKGYDTKYRAKKLFGEYWESALLIYDIEKEYEQAEVREQNNLHNKAQKRKKKWKQLQKRNYLQLT